LDKKDNIPVVNSKETKKCQNCGHEDTGNFCSNCGQNFAILNRPIKEIFAEILDIIDIDRRIINSIIPFLFKPGFLTREYLSGKRKKYISPVRLYLLLSLLFFFLVQSTSRKLSGDNDWLNITNDTTDVVIKDDSLAIELLKSDSLFGLEIDSLASPRLLRKAKRNNRLSDSAVDALSNKSGFLQSFYRNTSYVLFLLMPVFALLMKLLFIRRRVFYIEHLMFSINMHSFMLLIFSLVIILNQIIGDKNQFISILFIIVPVYFTIGMKRFYRQSFWRIILKEFIIGVMYTIILIVTLFFAGFITLYFF